jgi:hypothetical protein
MIRTEDKLASKEIMTSGTRLMVRTATTRSQPMTLFLTDSAWDLFKFSHICADNNHAHGIKTVIKSLTISLGSVARMTFIPSGCSFSKFWVTSCQWANGTVDKETKP